MPLSMDINYLFVDGISSLYELDSLAKETNAAREILLDEIGKGSEFTGWKNPDKLNSPEEMARLKNCAKRIRGQSDVVVVAAVGGSYLGSRAAIEYMGLGNQGPEILFAGNDLCESHLLDVVGQCEGKRVSVIVISKSGTTAETAIAFRILKRYMFSRYKDEAPQRIVAITDKHKGALRELVRVHGFESFEVPADVGGRYSVLTPVGLLPIMASGIDGEELIRGARDAADYCMNTDFADNICLRYAAARHLFIGGA
jgi:glucose-6-phosphate isomerase